VDSSYPPIAPQDRKKMSEHREKPGAHGLKDQGNNPDLSNHEAKKEREKVASPEALW
jgi:hypothetical protein